MLLMNIVIEGPKASGKSTIAKHFIRKDFKYFHSSNETKNDLDYHMQLLQDGAYLFGNLGHLKENRVIDRFSVGEMIYPHIYGRKSKLNWFSFVRTMYNPFTIYVILYASKEEDLLYRIKNRGEKTEDEAVSYVLESNAAFKLIGQNFQSDNVLLFDISKLTSKQIIEKIEEKMI